MEYIIILTLSFFIVLDLQIDRRVLTPTKIFNFVWYVVFSFYFLMMSYIQTTFCFRTLLIFFLCIFFYNFTYYFSMFIDKRFINKDKFKTKYNKNELKKIENCKLSEKNRIDKILKYINIIFILIFIFEIIYVRQIPLLSRLLNKNSNYLNFGITSLNGLLNSFAMCIGCYYLFKNDKRKYIYIIFAVLTLSRQVLITMAIESFVYNCFISPKEKMNKIICSFSIIAVVGFVLFTLIGNFRSGNGVMKQVFKPTSAYSDLPESIMWTYSYTEFSLSNFNNLVTMTNGGRNAGLSTLKFFLPNAITKRIKITPRDNAKYIISDNFNVSTWFPEIYLDFGLFGIIVFSVIIGLLGYYLYSNVNRYKTDKYALLYAVFVHNIIMFFFVNMFLYIPVAFQFAIILLIFKEKKYERFN